MKRKNAPQNRSAQERSKTSGRRVPGKPFKRGQSGNPATQFAAGISGNPSGRPKTAIAAQACRDMLAAPIPDDKEGRTYAMGIAQKLVLMALKGDLEAIREVCDRAEGKPRQSVDATVRAEVTATDRKYSEMSDEELAIRRAALQKVIDREKSERQKLPN